VKHLQPTSHHPDSSRIRDTSRGALMRSFLIWIQHLAATLRDIASRKKFIALDEDGN
jgi:hypothetical protein